jgi:acyl-CoA thioesterase-1
VMRVRVAGSAAWLLLVLPALTGCQETTRPSPAPEAGSPTSLLALGDSYTVGHSLPAQWSWPGQLADSLAAGGDTLRPLDIVAQSGWTTCDLLDALRERRDQDTLSREYGLVTLMIGVNNQFQDVQISQTAAKLDTLIHLALQLAGGDPGRVLGFSIPDYGVTPVGQLFGAEEVGSEIAQHNQLLDQLYQAHGITCLDITTVSLAAGEDPDLVARDGLHFSREMYRRWVELMLPEVRGRLGLENRRGAGAPEIQSP